MKAEQPSFFVRTLPRQPPRYLSTEDDLRLSYRSRYPQAPWRFVVGLDVLPAELWPPIEALEEGTSNPVHLEFYIGRIEEVEGAQVVARLWARPSGREFWAPLSIADHLRGQRWSLGSVVHVWTWIAFSLNGERTDRVFVKVQVRKGSGDGDAT